METLLKKVVQNKRVRLDNTFLPKHKRVLIKHTRRVLNKPVVNKKKVAKSADEGTNDLLDSQSSIQRAFWDSQKQFSTNDLPDSQYSQKQFSTNDLPDSQCSIRAIASLDSQKKISTPVDDSASQCSTRATCCSDSEKKVVTDDLLDSQCSISFLDSQGTTTVCSIEKKVVIGFSRDYYGMFDSI